MSITQSTAHQSERSDIFDVKPLGFHNGAGLPFLLLAAAAVVLVLGSALRKLLPRRQGKVALKNPFDRALESLQTIRSDAHGAMPAVRELSSRVSLTVRSYLGEVLRFPAEDRTIQELEESLPRMLDHLQKRSAESCLVPLLSVLTMCDRLTFAPDGTSPTGIAVVEARGTILTLVDDAERVMSALHGTFASEPIDSSTAADDHGGAH